MERERNLPQNHATKTYARTYDKSAKNVIRTLTRF